MHDKDDENLDTTIDNIHKIKTTKIVYPQIYSYTLPDVPINNGSQKIGYTERRNVDARIHEQTNTAAIRLRAVKQWSAPSFFADSKTDFKDKVFHSFLERNGIKRRRDLGNEWFYFNGTPEKSKELFDTFREQGFAALQSDNNKTFYKLREEQHDAVEQTLEYFTTHKNSEFLWNAKPRFGKTLTCYDLVKKLGAKNVLIVTNRPAIANSWFDDFEEFIDDYSFISSASSLKERRTLTREEYINQIDRLDKKQITFLSLQDLKGSKYFGGNHEKLKWVADLDWDLLVIDEAHEGVDTSRTDAAFDIINRQYTLHLSGTPFRALANNKFPAEAIFNWTYLDEQTKKREELKQGESGDHSNLPELRLYTYRISQMTASDVNEGIEIEGQTRDYAFDLNEFFSTTNQKFVHEDDVKSFLRNLSTNTKYPFSTPELRDELRHTFWYVGNRVDSVKALEQLLKQDDVFKDYKIIVAAGDGKTFDEEEADFKGNEESFNKVKTAIAEYPKTITLSCGQLTTGVTIKEWSAVLMLTDIKTPAKYMQAAFRAQNPYKFYENKDLKVKESAYLFDFAPTRVLEIYETFANGLKPKAVDGQITELERKQNVRELLNYFPVISEDVNGRMVELDSEKVLTFPNALAATEIVKARFMTNLLFNDNIKGVFHFPKEIEEILNKMPIEKNKRAEKTKITLDLDNARTLEQNRQAKIDQNSDVILGEKIYRANIDRLVDNTVNYKTPEESLNTLADKTMEIAEPLIAKYKTTYNVTNAEIEDVKKKTTEKVKLVVAEYESSDIKNPDKLKQDLKNVIEHDFVETKVEQQETNKVEEVQKSKEEMVREHLRAFTRTIPMFIMANSSKGEITIDNFDEQVSNEDFLDLTNITKDEFYMLRDGFDYTNEDGERKTFAGVFDKYRFNASIAEFIEQKKKRANYFETNEDIFELIPNQKNNQIFTPLKVVKRMIDDLETENPNLFQRTDSTFIDLYMKSGLYITEIIKRLFKNTRHYYDSDLDCVKHILENQVYGLAPTGILHNITQNYIFGFDDDHHISTENFKHHDLLPEAREGTASQKLANLYNREEIMKFDAVVGNPPYQDVTTGDSSQMPPIYHYFVDSAFAIAHIVCLITPARFLFNAGATPSAWNKKMLHDTHLKVLHYKQKSSEVFSNTDIKGGIAIIIRNSKVNSGAIGVFTIFEELNSILKKVDKTNPDSFSKIIYSAFSYQFSNQLHVEHPDVVNRLSAGHQNDISTKIFETLPDIFTEERPNNSNEYIRFYGLINKKRVYRWVKKSYIKPHPSLEKYKVWVPKANGSGAIGEVLSTPLIGTPLIGTPLIGTTNSFITIGALNNRPEASNILKYVKTKFARTLLGVLKITQDNPPGKWAKVPLQDFTTSSDINWSKPIPEIDQQLYRKYNLDQTEISFIESHVKPMK